MVWKDKLTNLMQTNHHRNNVGQIISEAETHEIYFIIFFLKKCPPKNGVHPSWFHTLQIAIREPHVVSSS